MYAILQVGSHNGGVSRGPRLLSPPDIEPVSCHAGSVEAAAPRSETTIWWLLSWWSQSVSGAPPAIV